MLKVLKTGSGLSPCGFAGLARHLERLYKESSLTLEFVTGIFEISLSLPRTSLGQAGRYSGGRKRPNQQEHSDCQRNDSKDCP
jgi:hypothetical protein